MLYLIGLGLSDEKDITLKGLEAVKNCDKIYLEHYTSKLSCDVKKLEELYSKPIQLADRSFIEGAEQLLEEAKNSNVALLIIGDPLCATTHWDILQRSKELNIKTEVIHNASIMSAIGASGLQVYKFGKITSIPFEEENFIPETPYNILKENQSIGAHTLLLLDLRPDKDRFMTIKQAIEFLLKLEETKKEGIFSEETLCIGLARVGQTDQLIISGTAKELLSVDFGPPVHALIVPGKLHFVEEEAIKQAKSL